MAAAAPLTPERRAVAAALLFLAAGALAGITLRTQGVEYRTFGLTEGLFALLLTYLLLLRGVWRRPPGVIGWIAVVYGTLAGAQILELLFPPPGIVEWVVVTGLAFSAWGALAGGTRERLVASLAGLALLLALLNFSVIPAIWDRAGPAPGEAFGLGNLAESFRRLFVDYQPTRPAGQLVAFLGIGCWALATRLLWVDEPELPRLGHPPDQKILPPPLPGEGGEPRQIGR